MIQWVTPRQYHVRLLDKEKTVLERIFPKSTKGKCCGSASGPSITFYIGQSSVKCLAKRRVDPLTNKWQNDTLRIMKKYEGLTYKQIEDRLKKHPHQVKWG